MGARGRAGGLYKDRNGAAPGGGPPLDDFGARLRGVTATDQPRQRFTTPVRVRYADTDATGTLPPSTYLMYYEVAQVDAVRGLGVPVG